MDQLRRHRRLTGRVGFNAGGLAIQVDSCPANSQSLTRGLSDGRGQLLELVGVLESLTDSLDQLLAAERRAVGPPCDSPGEVASRGFEQHGGEDRDRDGHLQSLPRCGEAQRDRNADVGAGDSDPQWRVDQRAAHRPVEVEQVRPEQSDDHGRRQRREGHDHQGVADSAGQGPHRMQGGREGRQKHDQDAVHRPAKLEALLFA